MLNSIDAAAYRYIHQVSALMRIGPTLMHSVAATLPKQQR